MTVFVICLLHLTVSVSRPPSSGVQVSQSGRQGKTFQSCYQTITDVARPWGCKRRIYPACPFWKRKKQPSAECLGISGTADVARFLPMPCSSGQVGTCNTDHISPRLSQQLPLTAQQVKNPCSVQGRGTREYAVPWVRTDPWRWK